MQIPFQLSENYTIIDLLIDIGFFILYISLYNNKKKRSCFWAFNWIYTIIKINSII